MWRDRIVSLLALLLLATLALGSYWLAQRARLGQPANAVKLTRHEPDYFADHFILHRLNPQGHLEYRVLADHMMHYPDDNTSVLSPNVLIERSAQGNRAPMQVRTDLVTFELDEDMIVTDRPVQVTQADSVLTGIGMRMDTAARKLQLNRDVKATWVQP